MYEATKKQTDYIKSLTAKIVPTDWPYPYPKSESGITIYKVDGIVDALFDMKHLSYTTYASRLAQKISNSCENMTIEEASLTIDWLKCNAGVTWASTYRWYKLLEIVPRLTKLLAPILNEWVIEAGAFAIAEEIRSEETFLRITTPKYWIPVFTKLQMSNALEE